MKNKKWKPKLNESYWCICSLIGFKFTVDVWDNHPGDEERYRQGNVFKKKRECQIKLKKILEILKEN